MTDWSNRETYIMVNWGLDKFSDKHLSGILNNVNLSESQKIQKIADDIRENLISYAEDLFPTLLDGANPVSELLNVAFNNINWHEMALLCYRNAKITLITIE